MQASYAIKPGSLIRISHTYVRMYMYTYVRSLLSRETPQNKSDLFARIFLSRILACHARDRVNNNSRRNDHFRDIDRNHRGQRSCDVLFMFLIGDTYSQRRGFHARLSEVSRYERYMPSALARYPPAIAHSETDFEQKHLLEKPRDSARPIL